MTGLLLRFCDELNNVEHIFFFYKLTVIIVLVVCLTVVFFLFWSFFFPYNSLFWKCLFVFEKQIHNNNNIVIQYIYYILLLLCIIILSIIITKRKGTKWLTSIILLFMLCRIGSDTDEDECQPHYKYKYKYWHSCKASLRFCFYNTQKQQQRMTVQYSTVRTVRTVLYALYCTRTHDIAHYYLFIYLTPTTTNRHHKKKTISD
jgi:hypothetical protein